MGNKKIILTAILIFCSFAFFDEAKAGCCIPPPPGNCFNSSESSVGAKCPSNETYNVAPCSTISLCSDAPKDCDLAGGTCEEGCDNESPIDGIKQCGGATPYCCKKSAASLECENCHENTSSNAPAGSVNGTIDFVNPVGATNLLQLVGSIMDGLRSVIVVVAIVFIVIGGIMYMSSAGSEKMIDKAKAIIGGALIGLAITLAAPTFLKEIISILGNASGGDPNEVISRALTVGQIAEKVLRFLLSIAGVLAIIGLVVGGFFYFVSYGEEERIDKGKEIITASLIGISVTLAAVLIVRQIMSLMM